MKQLVRHAAIALAFMTAGTAHAAPEPTAEAQVEAAVIYNLLLFVEWPDDIAAGSFRLCLFEGGALATALQEFAGKPIHGRLLTVRRVSTAPDDLLGCLAVAVGDGVPAALARASAAARTQPLLVVGKGTAAINRGAMIGLGTAGARIVFDIDLAAMRRARLGASSKLLHLARQVVD